MSKYPEEDYLETEVYLVPDKDDELKDTLISLQRGLSMRGVLSEQRDMLTSAPTQHVTRETTVVEKVRYRHAGALWLACALSLAATIAFGVYFSQQIRLLSPYQKKLPTDNAHIKKQVDELRTAVDTMMLINSDRTLGD
ncbi:MAG: hypothetical protein AABZ44_04895 [Elusimicrobiota bacterium]